MEQDSAIQLRTAGDDDSRDLWEWRNHAQVRKQFFNDEAVSWEDHQKWFDARLKDPLTRMFIAMNGEVKVGVIRFQQTEKDTTVSVTIDPGCFGKGWGTRVIQLGTELFWKETKTREPVIAEIKKENLASQRAFQKAGYSFKQEINNTVRYEICVE